MIRMPVLDLSKHVVREQIAKVLEETTEIYEAVHSGNKDWICEECLDLIQSSLGLLLMVAPEKGELIKQVLRHELKLKCREADGGLKISGWMNIEYQQEY